MTETWRSYFQSAKLMFTIWLLTLCTCVFSSLSSPGSNSWNMVRPCNSTLNRLQLKQKWWMSLYLRPSWRSLRSGGGRVERNQYNNQYIWSNLNTRVKVVSLNHQLFIQYRRCIHVAHFFDLHLLMCNGRVYAEVGYHIHVYSDICELVPLSVRESWVLFRIFGNVWTFHWCPLQEITLSV